MVAPEKQVKTLSFTYPEFCIVLDAVTSLAAKTDAIAVQLDEVQATAMAGEARDYRSQIQALYVRLAGRNR